MFENEYWILKAHDILQQAIFSPDSVSPCQQQRIGAQWKRLRAIFSTRIGYIRLGNRSNGVPKLQDVVPRLSVEDLEEDLRFSWFVSCELKQKLIQVLLASCELTADSEPLCRLLTWRSPLAQTVTVSSGHSNHPLMGDADRIEQLLGDWKSRHQRLLMADAVDDISTNPLNFPLFVSEAMLRLLFEYVVSALHRTLSSAENSHLSSWVAKICEISHQTLKESALRTTHVISDVLKRKAMRFLNTHAVICLSVPLTMNYLTIKTSMQCSPQAVHDLSTCLQAMDELALRFEVVDFFRALNDQSLALAHQILAKELPAAKSNNFVNLFAVAPVDVSNQPDDQMGKDVYKIVSRFQEHALACGCVERNKFLLSIHS
ncbi:hypothetical protein Z517_02877 [Fonsecaea pedrosoi CBS 271.37]|uniref:Unplaced genomic scaffold supercont1.2, whole genome shotgun sequence n=1 Tax=Fonsecaea pedrosoi CBS 271.37 TaxID=1442368 RepID=A0A0D2E0Q7_9EURO|nr:uncharacterized protein Z517_02877 [Fonsecaea pedrosoi CBS 271.37]KIW83631.1 hypothetical protein Z517_02877 [Fonsecaea pedrosoi CBS 271.37]